MKGFFRREGHLQIVGGVSPSDSLLCVIILEKDWEGSPKKTGFIGIAKFPRQVQQFLDSILLRGRIEILKS